jgi:hypothetical protein
MGVNIWNKITWAWKWRGMWEEIFLLPNPHIIIPHPAHDSIYLFSLLIIMEEIKALPIPL